MADCTRVAAAGLLEEVLEGERVHDGAQHAHVVGSAAVHAALAQLGAAEEVASSDDDGDLDAIDGSGDVARDLRDHIGADAQLTGPESLAGELEKDAAASSAFSHVGVSSRPDSR